MTKNFKEEIKCPRCGHSSFLRTTKGYNEFGNPEVVYVNLCMNCQHEERPTEDN